MMSVFRWITVVAGFAFASAPLRAGAEPMRYRFLPDSSFLTVRLRPAPTLLSGLSHKHVVRAPAFDGFVEYDREQPDQCTVQVRFPVASLVVDAPSDRKRSGFKDTLSDSDREDIRENMLDDDQLNAVVHKEIRFDSTSCGALPDGRIQVKGSLTIRGKTAPISVALHVAFADGQFHAEGEFTLEHQVFGFKPYSAALGTLKNHPELKFGVEVTGQRLRAIDE